MSDVIGKIDGPLFRNQRLLLLKIADLAQHKQPYLPAPGDSDLLEGLINLTDEIADEAHDLYGLDSLIKSDEGEEPDDGDPHNQHRCECELPGYFCSGVPGILAHLDNGRLSDGAKVERCGLCCRYPSDTAALEKLQELGHAPL